MISLASQPIDPAALLDEFTRSAQGCGAIVSFTGLVRGDNGVRTLWLDHHERLTVASITGVADEIRQRFALLRLSIVHRIGLLELGEPIVFVAACATHRRAAFDAVDLAMDRLKTAIPLWKCEMRADGPHWVEPREQDHADAARWALEHG